jgi:starch synthase
MTVSGLRIAVVASEATPFAKTGGLADVIGSLPGALRKLGLDVRVILPGYRRTPVPRTRLIETDQPLAAWLGSRRLPFHIRELLHDSHEVPVTWIEREDLFDRPNLYGNRDGDYYDNAARFIFFCRAVVEYLQAGFFRPDIVHCHDWQTGLIPVYLNEDPSFTGIQSLFTVHNMGYPGLFPYEEFSLTGLSPHHYRPEGLEFYGLWSMLKAGLVYSRAVNTVSPTHALEIQTAEYGWGMEGVIRYRKDSVYGILNGVDDRIWDPAIDTDIPCRYSLDHIDGKQICRQELIRECGMENHFDSSPVIGVISRLDVQKGMDLLIAILESLVDSDDAKVVILGTGDPALQNGLEEMERRRPGKNRFFPRFDSALARRILAGSDMLLMPSRYEPCGLTQLYALKYGTIPIARATGGLRDTVIPWNEETREGTGFLFDSAEPQAFLTAIRQAVGVFRRPEIWRLLQAQAMKQDFSWNRAAMEYLGLYHSILV